MRKIDGDKLMAKMAELLDETISNDGVTDNHKKVVLTVISRFVNGIEDGEFDVD